VLKYFVNALYSLMVEVGMNKNLTIAVVAQEAGLTREVLRVWERRYGFPQPARDANGERLYPLEQLERLKLIKRLIDLGHRPSKLMGLASPALEELLARLHPTAAPDPRVPAEHGRAVDFGRLLALIQSHEDALFLQTMQYYLMRLGLQRFILEVVSPMTFLVGSAWEEGTFSVAEEHLYTELTRRLLRQVLDTLPRLGAGPSILLSTLPGEIHELGLLMAEALLTLEGARCVSLGTQTPPAELLTAALQRQVNVVAVSFSLAFPRGQVVPELQALRAGLPTAVQLWAGGTLMRKIPAIPGVMLMPELSDGLAALARWSAAAAPG
jgi:methanogenic corrinoid protein MtbC1